ncbi:MAG TPA: chromate resistance protein ChrB domain-containing protein [Vicinamibacterales bacterium]|nr:chromate resistance protein ChrB domain-containing protein [Vicinamibacterales bacterium]
MSPGSPPLWLLLVHQIPPRPLYLRAKIRRRLLRVGAIAVKNSVYVLPDRGECLEDFQWIAQEAVAGGGEAFVGRVELVTGLAADALVDRFRAEVTSRYEPLQTALEKLLARTRTPRRPSAPGTAANLTAFRRQVDEIRRTDFFQSPAGREVEALMTALDRARRPAGRRPTTARLKPRDLRGRVWVTREDPHSDRLATAWLVRRFIDPAAEFRFVPAPGGGVRPDEISFDMVDATFGHEGDHCTFETVLARLSLTDPALGQISEVIHDIDLKDGKFGRPEAAGIQQLLQGLTDAHADSASRVAAGLPVFDALFASFGGRSPSGSRPRTRAAQPRARR